MNDLTSGELQEIVLVAGSRKALGVYLRLSEKELTELWKKHRLKSPTQLVQSLPDHWLATQLVYLGSIKKLARHLGVSEATLRKRLPVLSPSQDFLDHPTVAIAHALERYKSVKLAARFLRVKESQVRKCAEDLHIPLNEMVDYAFSNHSNAKGRRAEIDFAKWRGSLIRRDLNVTLGSQAPYDFDDNAFGKVNVKSSRQHSYTSKARRDNPHYWKFSTKGRKHCDRFVCMFYNADMTELLGYRALFPGDALGATVTFTAEDMTCL